MFLSEKDFSSLVTLGPIISIDLCVIQKNNILLGKRTNPPAKDSLFVPGGRIFKNETIQSAIERIIKNELGLNLNQIKEKSFLGVFQHFYEDNFLGNKQFNSHYIVLAYTLLLDKYQPRIKEQHSEYIWFNGKNYDEKFFIENVHPYSRDYINNSIISSKLNKNNN